MKSIKKEDVTLILVLLLLGILTYGWVPGAISQIAATFSSEEAP